MGVNDKIEIVLKAMQIEQKVGLSKIIELQLEILQKLDCLFTQCVEEEEVEPFYQSIIPNGWKEELRGGGDDKKEV